MDLNEVYNKTKEIIIGYLRVDDNEVTPEANLVDDLCADSIALVELNFRFSETFSIPMIEPTEGLFVMKDLVAYLCDQINKKNAITL